MYGGIARQPRQQGGALIEARRGADTAVEKREKCGIFGIYSKGSENVAPYIYRGIQRQQHRGQDAAGITVDDNGNVQTKKALGLVTEVFSKADLKGMKGSVGIGHVRYPTMGVHDDVDQAQPFVKDGVALASNGQIANYDELKAEYADRITLKTTSDTELQLELFLLFYKTTGTIEGAVAELMRVLDGSYSTVAMVNGKLIAFRDPNAIRPLVYGENGSFVSFASESCALDINDIEYAGDVKGGQLAVVEGGRIVIKTLVEETPHHCYFEWVYFADGLSEINGLDVDEARTRIGAQLAVEKPVERPEDVIVVPVPDTARTGSQGYAEQMALGNRYTEGLRKNPYIGRTFIMPDQEYRSAAVKLKMFPSKRKLKGKRVVLNDDSIVRGTTLKDTIGIVRKGGATEVHVRITSPPIRHPCPYGVDMRTEKELVAAGRTEEQVRDFLGADSLGYLSTEGLKKALRLPICTGCLDGNYPTAYARKLHAEALTKLKAELPRPRDGTLRYRPDQDNLAEEALDLAEAFHEGYDKDDVLESWPNLGATGPDG